MTEDFEDEEFEMPEEAIKIPVMVDVPMLQAWEHELKYAANRTMTEEKWVQFEKLCAMRCTKFEVASVFGMKESEIDKLIRERYDEGFKQVLDRFSGVGNAALRRAQMQKALEGNVTMQKFLGMNMLGQASKAETKNETTHNVIISKEQRDAAIQGLISDMGDDLVIEIPDADWAEVKEEIENK